MHTAFTQATGKLVLLLVLFFGVLDAHAQGRGKISGKVTEASTGEVLPGVNVVIDGTTMGTATDLEGDYFIANLQPGEYTLRVSSIGFKPTTIQGISVHLNTTTEINIELEEETLMGEEVVVTAERALVEKDNTTSVVRMEAEEVSARPTADFTDVLTTLPSINIENGQVRVRGGTLDQVAFMIDGARARNPLDHSPYTRINLSSIEAMEVITGSFNAEYGEAQSGVINVVTKDGSDKYEFYLDTRFEPPGTRHWGDALYDYDSPVYWENTHARHLDWWIEYPDQWVDPNGTPGSNPNSLWTPEEAYQNYLATHQPLTDYTGRPTYEMESSLGGPVPFLNNLFFFASGKYRSQAPIMGNAFRKRGQFYDGTMKLNYRLGAGKKIVASAFYGQEEAGWGFWPDADWALNYGNASRYAYFDQDGYPFSRTNGQTLTYSHAVNSATYYEVKMARVQAERDQDIFPGDTLGFEASDAQQDNLRARDQNGDPIPGGFANNVGYHTSGYLYRFEDNNVEWKLEGELSSQINKFWHLQSGIDFSYYLLDHYNQSKYPTLNTDDRTYKPYQGAAYLQNKLEFRGFIMNAGIRLDFYNPNDTVYVDVFNPLGGEKQDTKLYYQLSPRIGISHPIDEQTVLHFSYGHFFQRPSFGDYGEGGTGVSGSLTTFIFDDVSAPLLLGNRMLRPTKVVAFEVGIERNFWDFFVLDLTGYYKDIRNTIRTVEVDPGSSFPIYRTNANGNYGDNKGVEISLRKVPSTYSWGSLWGYANFATQRGIVGASGAPRVVRQAPDGDVEYVFGGSGDVIEYKNPILKFGLYYQTPEEMRGVVGNVLSGISVALDYRAVFPNENLRSDFFLFEGQKHLRPIDQASDLRLRKQIELVGGARLSPYIQVSNVFNDKWVYLPVVERASPEAQRRFVESNFEDVPDRDNDGRPMLDIAKFRNLPRSVLFGLTLEM